MKCDFKVGTSEKESQKVLGIDENREICSSHGGSMVEGGEDREWQKN